MTRFLACGLLLVASNFGFSAVPADGSSSNRIELVENWKLASAQNMSVGGKAISDPGYGAASWHPITRMPATVLEILQEDGVYPDRVPGNQLQGRDLIANNQQIVGMYASHELNRFKDQVRQRTRRTIALSSQELLTGLNPLLRGWGEYYKRVQPCSFVRANPCAGISVPASIRESCIRETRPCSFNGGRRPAPMRASSEPTAMVDW